MLAKNPNINGINATNAIKEHIDYADCKITRVEIKHGQDIGTSCIDLFSSQIQNF